MFDCLIVGCGFAGSVIARFLAEQCGKKVLILERRNHIAGNMFDFTDGNGIRVQKYGPHTFHTNQKKLYDYIQKYGDWENYKLICMSKMDGKFTPSPFNFQTIDDFYTPEKAAELKEHIKNYYEDVAQVTIVEMLKCPDPVIQQYAQFLYDKDFSLYTAKQWGISPFEIDPGIFKRVPVLFSYKRGYFDDAYQVMPKNGFTEFFQNILNHPNIEIRLNTDARPLLNFQNGRILVCGKLVPVVYTGALDELFDFRFGPLPYRSLQFEYHTKQTASFQPAPVIAYPQAEGYTRITEYTKLPVQSAGSVTTIAVEYSLPYKPGMRSEPYYPILTEENTARYRLYLREAEKINNLFLCGRLADYKYYNMDQVLDRSLKMCRTLMERLKKQETAKVL